MTMIRSPEAARVPGLSMRWEELDKNKDGVLSREEFLAGYRARP